MLKKQRDLVIALLIPRMMVITPFGAHAWLLDTDKSTYTSAAKVTAGGTADTGGNPDGNYVWFGKTYSGCWVGERGAIIKGSKSLIGSLWTFNGIIINPPTNPGTWSLSATSGLPPMSDADHYATVDPSANYPSWTTKIVSSPAKTVTP